MRCPKKMSKKAYKEAREATKMGLGIALHNARQEVGYLSTEDVAKTILSVWHVSDVEVLIKDLKNQIEQKKPKE
jgi:hypothetical protein